MSRKAFLILGNQLFDPKLLKGRETSHFFLREDAELCTHFKYHQLKLALFLNAMRSYADELRDAGFQLTYQELKKSRRTYDEHLADFLREERITEIELFEVEDKFFEDRLTKLFERLGIKASFLPSPMFLTSRAQFQEYLSKYKKPFMRRFYEQQRKRLKILVDAKGDPVGGRWSFDEMNRKPLPAGVIPPPLELKHDQPHAKAVAKLCAEHFGDHPGSADAPWFATSRAGARAWLRKFLSERFSQFGPYEDALTPEHDFLFHSVLTPYLNTGLLTPREVIVAALKAAEKQGVNIESLEGFVRQIIAWREFIRGIYQNYSEHQEKLNFFGHERQLTAAWYDGSTGIRPLDDVLKKVARYGYAHHIERLMVVGNLMLLCEVHPHAAHAWFMEMFIDSSDWVMGPNVYGMAIFSDGGVFATKPYICGSNYYRKMGKYGRGNWSDGVDGLYWGFIDKNREFFATNPRLSMTLRTLDRMAPAKKELLFAAGKHLRDRITKAA